MDNEILKEMKENGLNKQQQLQKWGERQGELLRLYGGSVSDIPVDPTHEYHILDSKIRQLSQLNVEAVEEMERTSTLKDNKKKSEKE